VLVCWFGGSCLHVLWQRSGSWATADVRSHVVGVCWYSRQFACGLHVVQELYMHAKFVTVSCLDHLPGRHRVFKPACYSGAVVDSRAVVTRAAVALVLQ
jgi:hypothetical protein